MNYFSTHFNKQLAFKGLFASGLMILSFNLPWAQGDLLVFPKRVVFENREKIELINLTNIGEDTATYKISFVQYRMTEYGKFELLNEPDTGQYFANPFIRYYPRTVTLGPKESQAIKLQLIKTNSLLPVEYRSHLYFRSESRKMSDETLNPHQDSSLSIKLIPVLGLTIPCIIHPVEPVSEITLTNLEFLRDKNSNPQISMEFNRKGHFSTYGNIIANYISPNGHAMKIGEVKGFAVYTPGVLRKCIMNISLPEGVDFTNGIIQVVYSSPSPGSHELASTSINLTP